MLVYMTHPNHGTHIAYDHAEVERCKENGWVVAEELKEPKEKTDISAEIEALKAKLQALEKVAEAQEVPEMKPEEQEDAQVSDIDAIRSELDAAGIKYDGRLGADKLRELLP